MDSRAEGAARLRHLLLLRLRQAERSSGRRDGLWVVSIALLYFAVAQLSLLLQF